MRCDFGGILVGTRRLSIVLLLWFLPSGSVGQTVPPVDLSSIRPSSFSDEELDLPYYLQHFHTLANSVVMSGPNRGFIDLPVWRNEQHLSPYNARIMENVLSLAYFYATDRPWNPYYGDLAVRERLEAALQFWVDMQSEEGLFSETGENKWGISPTGFATKFMGETLQLLHDGPPLDPGILADVAESDRRAIEAFLRSEDFFEHGTRYSNHYTTVWGGALAYLDLYPDEELERLLTQRLFEGLAAFQSPAGFFYERRGADWGFDIETHHSNHLVAWEYLRDTELAHPYVAAVERWYDWLAYNAVLEPDTSGFTMNHAIETRLTFPFYKENRMTTFGRTCLPIAEHVVLARAFCESQEERAKRLSARRGELERSWPNIPGLKVGEFYGYSPYAFLHRNHARWHPTSRQKAEARAQLPYRRSDAVLHQRADARPNIGITYIGHPSYYAAFNVGEQTDQDQQFGLGIIWTPRTGALLQSQRIEGMSWGTSASEDRDLYESEILEPRFELVGESVQLEDGSSDIAPGTFSVAYDLGARGRKNVTFTDDEIIVSIEHGGPFTETIPLLLGDGDRAVVDGTVVRVSPELRISYGANASASVRRTDRRIGRKLVQVVEIRASGGLEYRLQF